jgi:hypothetical protein
LYDYKEGTNERTSSLAGDDNDMWDHNLGDKLLDMPSSTWQKAPTNGTTK